MFCLLRSLLLDSFLTSPASLSLSLRSVQSFFRCLAIHPASLHRLSFATSFHSPCFPSTCTFTFFQSCFFLSSGVRFLFLAYSQLLEILFRCGQQGCVNSHYFVFISGVSLPASSYCFHFCLNSHHPLFCRHLPPLASSFLRPNAGFRDTSIAEMLGTECNT